MTKTKQVGVGTPFCFLCGGTKINDRYKYCSRKCTSDARLLARTDKHYAPSKPKTRCLICGGVKKKEKYIYCSVRCTSVSRARQGKNYGFHKYTDSQWVELIKDLHPHRQKVKINGETFALRSKLELLCCKELKASGLDFDYESLIIRYRFEGVARRYIPDFLVLGRIIVECKLHTAVDDPKVIAKRKASIKEGYKFVYYTYQTVKSGALIPEIRNMAEKLGIDC